MSIYYFARFTRQDDGRGTLDPQGRASLAAALSRVVLSTLRDREEGPREPAQRTPHPLPLVRRMP